MSRLLSIFLLLGWPSLGSAEILPTSGTFNGVYHEDRWGEGAIRFFRVKDKELRKQLAPYEGRYISLEVISGAQERTTSDPVTVYKIGKVEKLDSPILQVKVRCIPENPRPSTPFVVWVELWNTGDHAVKIYANYQAVQLVVAHSGETDKPIEKVDDLIQDFEYQRFSWRRSTKGGVFKVYSQASWLPFGYQTDTLAKKGNRMATVSQYTIPPNDYVPFAKRFGRGFLPGEYEIRASAPADGRRQAEANRENYAWVTLDVVEDNKKRTEKPVPLRIVEKSLKKLDDTYHLRIRAAPNGDKAIRIPMGQNGRWLAGLWAYDSDSNIVESEMEKQLRLKGLYEWDDVWQFAEVPKDGLVLERRFSPKRKDGRLIQRRELAKVSLELFTDQGAQSIDVSVDESKPE